MGVAGFQGCWKAGALHNLCLKVCSVWKRLSFEDDWIGSSNFSSILQSFALFASPLPPGSSHLWESGKITTNLRSFLGELWLVYYILIACWQIQTLFKENPLLKTGSVAMWTFLGKTHFSCYFLFSSFIGGLKFSGFIFLIQCFRYSVFWKQPPVWTEQNTLYRNACDCFDWHKTIT